MPWQGHDALDLRVPVDVGSSAATRQEPSVPFESAPDSSSGGVHACRYLHDRTAESQPARQPCVRQDTVDLVSDRAQRRGNVKDRRADGGCTLPAGSAIRRAATTANPTTGWARRGGSDRRSSNRPGQISGSSRTIMEASFHGGRGWRNGRNSRQHRAGESWGP